MPARHRSAALLSFPDLQGEQCEFAAYGLLYAAASGREVLSHEMGEVARRLGGSGGGSGTAAGAAKCGASGHTAATAVRSNCGGGGGGGAAATGGSAASGPDLAADRFVGHALAACRAYLAGNVVRFLRMYEGAPRMAPYLLDLLLAKLRGRAYSERAAGGFLLAHTCHKCWHATQPASESVAGACLRSGGCRAAWHSSRGPPQSKSACKASGAGAGSASGGGSACVRSAPSPRGAGPGCASRSLQSRESSCRSLPARLTWTHIAPPCCHRHRAVCLPALHPAGCPRRLVRLLQKE